MRPGGGDVGYMLVSIRTYEHIKTHIYIYIERETKKERSKERKDLVYQRDKIIQIAKQKLA